ncbi:hypothetical protein [Actinokineospora sp. NBRC 105648]|uniref:hypothetical protein n=1 Tax=Actinokineospora sp. NBRC 105648 TaxID=3032206 RepID=UPI0024A3E792|nr:hypothetical protein [Actinokineospora sp. NBRC 105648]GLZ42234.1 hypothetical protein Acsp05_58580 [Actinokineospora sp. NBRC 105648]
MLDVPSFARAAARLGVAVALVAIPVSAAGLAHAQEPVEYLCGEVVTDNDLLTAASQCVGGPTDYDGPATVVDFLEGVVWSCDRVVTEVDPNVDDPDFSRITETENCVLASTDDPNPSDPVSGESADSGR